MGELSFRYFVDILSTAFCFYLSEVMKLGPLRLPQNDFTPFVFVAGWRHPVWDLQSVGNEPADTSAVVAGIHEDAAMHSEYRAIH